MSFIYQWSADTWGVVAQAAPWLLAGFVAAGAIHVLLPTQKVIRHLGGGGLMTVLKASLLGIPLPLCSCSVIPVATSIRKQGAGRGATASFLISTPETGVDSIALSYAMLGPFLAVVRPVAAFVTAMVAGGLIDRWDRDKRDATPHVAAADTVACHSCCHHEQQQPRVTLPSRLRAALRYGLIDMFRDLSHWLVLGFILAGLAATLFPPGFLEAHIGTGLGAMLLMAAVGLPVYVCATSSTPLAATLIAQGLSPGAALVFLLVGPATNLATMLVVGRDLGWRNLVVYILTIAAVALGCGALTDALLDSSLILRSTLVGHQHADHDWPAYVAAVLLAGLILNGLRLRFIRRPQVASHESCAPAAE